MRAISNDRVRWEQQRQIYILTTPNAMILSYKALNRADPLENNLISMFTPIPDGQGGIVNLDYISERFERYLNEEHYIDMTRVGQDYFVEKLHCVADDMELTEEHIAGLTDSFEDNKGFRLNTGKGSSPCNWQTTTSRFS